MMHINWNSNLPWIIAGAVVAILVLWIFLRSRKRRIFLRRQLSAIAYQLKLSHPAIKPYPVLTLHGQYYSYDIAIESKTKSDPHYPGFFRIHLDLQHELKGRLYIQSEAKPAKIARLYGMEVIITGNAAFDNQVLVCSTNEPSAQLLFTPYLIERFLRVQFPPFSIDYHKHHAYAEISLSSKDDVTPISHLAALMVEIAEFLHQGDHSLEPFTPPPMAA
jgi:hypothetical protein